MAKALRPSEIDSHDLKAVVLSSLLKIRFISEIYAGVFSLGIN